MNFKTVPQKTADYILTNSFWIKLMLKSCMSFGISYIAVQIIIQLTPLITVWIWKFIIDELESIYMSPNYDMYIWLLIFVYLAVQLISSTLSSVSTIFEDKIYRKTRYSLNLTIIEKMSHLDASFFSDPANADKINAAQQSEIYFAKCIPSEVSTTIGVITFVIGLTTFLAYYPLGGILFLLTYIPGAIYSYIYRKKMDQYSIRKIPEDRERNYYKRILTVDAYAKDLRLYNLKAYMFDKYYTLRNKIRTERTAMFKNNTVISFLISLLTYSSLVVVIVLSVISVVKGRMSIGMLTMYVGLAQTTGSAFQSLVSKVAFSIQGNSNEYKKYMQFASYKDVIKYTNTRTITSCPSVEFRNVYFKYPGCNTYALENMSFKIESGEKIAVIGTNGAGKTTIVKLLLRFYAPTDGEILIDGHDIREYSAKELYKAFSVCLQGVNVYAMTLRENIAISDVEKINDMAAIRSAAHKTGLDELVNSLPNGYESNMCREFYEDGVAFSGGQNQKLAISRAFFKNSKFVILDEPSSALDPIAEDMIFSSFKRVCQERGGILISHRLSTVMMVDKIILLDNGKVAESGTHQQLIDLNGKYAEMYNMQAQKYKGGK